MQETNMVTEEQIKKASAVGKGSKAKGMTSAQTY